MAATYGVFTLPWPSFYCESQTGTFGINAGFLETAVVPAPWVNDSFSESALFSRWQSNRLFLVAATGGNIGPTPIPPPVTSSGVFMVSGHAVQDLFTNNNVVYTYAALHHRTN